MLNDEFTFTVSDVKQVENAFKYKKNILKIIKIQNFA